MKIKKKALLYDISNLAYMIADTGETGNHTLHRVRDICQDGNIDRVSRILGLAYSRILAALSPLIISPELDPDIDYSVEVRDYEINFKDDNSLKYCPPPEIKLKIKETAHEYMVSLVLADWLGSTLPPAADVWKEKALFHMQTLKDMADEVSSAAVESFTAGFRRKLSPF